MEDSAQKIQEMIESKKECLYSREIDVLTLRFGLGGIGVHTYEEAAEIMGITPERVRQIEKRAIYALHRRRSRKPIRDFYLQD